MIPQLLPIVVTSLREELEHALAKEVEQPAQEPEDVQVDDLFTQKFKTSDVKTVQKDWNS